jgi:hypothetical protein
MSSFFLSKRSAPLFFFVRIGGHCGFFYWPIRDEEFNLKNENFFFFLLETFLDDIDNQVYTGDSYCRPKFAKEKFRFDEIPNSNLDAERLDEQAVVWVRVCDIKFPFTTSPVLIKSSFSMPCISSWNPLFSYITIDKKCNIEQAAMNQLLYIYI